MDQSKESTPEWLNNSFLENALQSYRRDDSIEVLSFNVKTGFSEHFASTMFQCKVKFRSTEIPKSEPETLNMVIKAGPIGDGFKTKIVAGGPFFETEIRMYKETLPVIHQLFESSGLKAELAPELIYATDKPFPIIILKDLTQDGFEAPRQPPEELEDSKLIIQKLAQFHAASFYLTETNQQDFTQYDFTFYKNDELVNGIFLDTLLIFKDVIKSWDEYQEFLPKVEHLIENVSEIGQRTYTANKSGNGYNVLNHGDWHMRNMLVKNNATKNIEKFYFIDYQLSVYPCVDLSNLFINVKRDEDGEIPYNELIMTYHEEFVKALKVFGYKSSPPSLLDLNVELLRHGAIETILLICFLPFSFIDWKNFQAEDFILNDSEKSRDLKKKLYENPMVKKLLQREMRSWIFKGWF